MSTYESSYKTLLQGVSQQIPSSRLPGQVTSQTNMISDPVTGLRRRPGVKMTQSWNWTGLDDSHLAAWYTDIAGSKVHILLNTNTGNIRILGEDYIEQANLDAGAYLTATDLKSIRGAAAGNEFFLANTTQVPVLQYKGSASDPANSGFFYITAGAFSKVYNATVVYSGGTLAATYTTPDGTHAGDAALSTPEYIANQLLSQINGGAVDRVRIQTFAFTGTTINAFEKNTGTSSAPVWVAVSLLDEFLIGDVQSKLRLRYKAPGGGGHFNCTYKVSRGGVWDNSTVYTASSVFLEWTEPPATQSLEVLPASLFTSNVPLTGLANLIVGIVGPYVFISQTGGIQVTTTVGAAYMIASQNGFVTSAGSLPAQLPVVADGYICRVGSGTSPQYYRYNAAKTEWEETSAFGSPSAISNCPISIYWTGSTWALNTGSFEGRLAGNDNSNHAHDFMIYGITGMATYQGRLVLMSGPLVSLSASNLPRRFFRSTVTSLLPNDAMEIGSGMNTSAAYEWAVSFQKDLILFSSEYQAVLPSGNAAITPATATVVPTSGNDVDTTSCPINLGRTLMYCNPRSEDYFGAMEMVPSQYTDSQYVSMDSTPHLPKYLPGRCRFAVPSTVANLALFAPTGDTYALFVHEFRWDGDQKTQQAWHRWTFDYPVAQAYFVGDVVVVVFVKNNQIVLGKIDPRAGAVDNSGNRRPFLDLNFTASIVNHVITIPSWITTFDPAVLPSIAAIAGTGTLAGELVGTSVTGATLTTVLSWPSGTVGIGLPYYSGFIPSPPQVTDYKDNVVHSGKATVLRFMIETKNSSDFNLTITDRNTESDEAAGEVLFFDSAELELGRGLFSNNAMSIVPTRTEMRSTSMEVSTQGTGELNIISLEYVARYTPKIKRR